MPNPLAKLINPWYPSTAVGFEKGLVTMVQLERGRGGTSTLRRAATVALPESLIRPSFDEQNISDPGELVKVLSYLVVACRASILGEYESALNSLGWRAGLIVPRHIGEGQWLTMNGAQGDALLVSSSETGFTAVVFRGKQPLIIRSVACDADECEDELYRLLLFYRDRRRSEAEQMDRDLSRVLVVGELLDKHRACEIVNETLGSRLRSLDAADLGLQIATRELSFDAVAAPAGLASLSWQ